MAEPLEIKTLTGNNEVDDFISLPGRKILYFGGRWCEPCRNVNKQLKGDNVFTQYLLSERIQVYQIDVDTPDAIAIADRHRVSVVPTIEVYVDNRNTGSFAGFNNAVAVEKIKYFISRSD